MQDTSFIDFGMKIVLKEEYFLNFLNGCCEL